MLQGFGGGDEDLVSASFDERQRAFDLGPHGARRELAISEMGPGFRRSHAVNPPLAGLAEIQGHLWNARKDDVEFRAKIGGQQGAQAVLVDDRLHAHQESRRIADHRNPATATRDDAMPALQQGLDGAQLHDLDGLW